MGQVTSRRYLGNHLDLVITNAVVVDWTGIYKVIYILQLSLAFATYHFRQTLESKTERSPALVKPATPMLWPTSLPT